MEQSGEYHPSYMIVLYFQKNPIGSIFTSVQIKSVLLQLYPNQFPSFFDNLSKKLTCFSFSSNILKKKKIEGLRLLNEEQFACLLQW